MAANQKIMKDPNIQQPEVHLLHCLFIQYFLGWFVRTSWRVNVAQKRNKNIDNENMNYALKQKDGNTYSY